MRPDRPEGPTVRPDAGVPPHSVAPRPETSRRTGPGRSALIPVLFALALVPALSSAHPRPHEPLDGGALAHELARLQVVGSALYVAAHPDDENTRLIASLANGRLADAAYLSMTRGDGGQILIGPEIGDLLGIIRSQELLAARAEIRRKIRDAIRRRSFNLVRV